MMKRFLVGTFASLFLTLSTAAFSAGTPEAPRYVPGQIIIKFKSSALKTDQRALSTDLNATVKQRFESIGAELWEIGDIAVLDAVEQYRNDPRVVFVEPNYIVHTNDLFPNDPRFSELWGLHNTAQTGGVADADVDAPEAWSLGTGGTVLVGVIDTGVDWHHTELAANIYTNPGEIPDNDIDDDANGFVDDVRGWDFYNNDNDPVDDNGHGTHVSGTIAAIGNNGIGVVGVCWSARILPLKFLDEYGYGSTSDAVRAVEYATKMGARLTSNSWGGGGFSTALQSAIQEAGDHGILFIAAAGNSSDDNDIYPHYPSSYDLDNVIAVASTDHRDEMSDFSCFGLISVDLGAPGSDVLSTLPNNRYGVYSGTSMATPHVAGAACLVWAAAPTMTHLEIKNALLSTVDPLPSLAGKMVSGGRLNLYTLLSSLDDIPPSRVNHLSVDSRGSSTVRLSWTATGDDSTVGTASHYDVRYSTAKITANNFDAATRASGDPHPAPAGSKDFFEVTGLNYNTKYYFALVVEDEQHNRSRVSDATSAMTLGAPSMVNTPGAFAASLNTGGTVTQFLKITNTAKGTLDFSVAASPSWLKVIPPVGRISAAKSLQVAMLFDATRVSGGAHDETVTLVTNDPARRNVVLPVSLLVTDAADITAEPLTIDFGVRYNGTCAHDTVLVTNIGAIALNVSSMSMNNPKFSTDLSPFSLAPDESRRLGIAFCPTTVGATQGTLLFQSNDPDHPTYAVSFRGQGVDPPIIAITPASLSADLLTGGISNQTLSVSNHGGSELSFKIAIEDLGGPTSLAAGVGSQSTTAKGTSRDITPATARRAETAQGVSYSGNRVGSRRGGLQNSPPVTPTLSDLKVLLLHAANVSEIRDLLLEFPDMSVVDEFEGGDATPDLATLTPYHAVILIANFPYSDPVAVGDVLADYVDGGGAVIMTIASFIDGWDVRGRFFSGGYYPFTLGYGPIGYAELSDFDPTHPIMRGASSAWGDLLAGTTLAPGAKWVADWDNGNPFVATQGDRVVGVNVFVSDGGWWGGDIPLVLHNAVAWATGAAWLNVEPMQGVVAPGGTLNIAVTSNAAGLYGGDYGANLRVANNTVAAPEVVVPVGLHVTGAPDIALSETLLDYGPQFVGAAITRTLVVSNDGTDLLTVSSISSSHPYYTVDVASFSLAPTESRNVVVTFAPTSVGPVPATLTINSNDFDEGALTVALQGQGVNPPIISVTPTSLSEDLVTGETATHSLTISNSGESDLSFSIGFENLGSVGSHIVNVSEPGLKGRVANPALAVSPQSARRDAAGHATSIKKGQRDTRSYPPMTHGRGGPDAGGYRWRDNNEPGGPVFNWIDVSGGTDLNLNDDDYATGIPLGFTFNYYGEAFSSIAVCSNGWLSFNGPDSWFPWGVPVEDYYYLGPIAPFAADLYPPDADYVRYQTFGVAPHRQFVIEYNDIPDYGGGSNKTFEVVLSEGANAIRFQYLVAPNQPYAFGIESPDELMGMGNAGTGDLFISPELVRDDYAIEFTASPLWLDAEPLAGVVPAQGSLNVEIIFSAPGSLDGGDYAANLHVINNDPLNADVAVAASIHITGAPDISLEPTSLAFDSLFIGASTSRTLVISNPGTDPLTVSSISSNQADYTVDVTTFSLAPKTNRPVVVTFTPTAEGPIAGVLTIVSDDHDEGTLTVDLAGSGVVPPVISVSPTSITEDLFIGRTSTRLLTIDNSTGGSDLQWGVSVPTVAWVYVLPVAGTVPAGSSAPVTAYFDANSLNGGIYDTNIAFSSNDPITPEVVVPTQLRVTGIPDVSVTPQAADYGPVYIGGPSSKTFIVSNGGTDLLTVASVSSNHANYTVDPAGFSLSPQATHNLVVSFTPTTADTIVGQVTITSDDPDEGTLLLQLTGTGVEPPVISVTPSAFADSLSAGDTSTHTVTVSNDGAGDLEIAVRLVKTPVGNSVALVADGSSSIGVEPVSSRATSDEDSQTYPSSGGPDPFGYRWRDSNDPDGPQFSWIDVSTGTNIPMADDDFEANIPLGFTFSYYGQHFTTIGVSSNGWLTFNGEDAQSSWFPVNVPLEDSWAGAIAPCARNFDPSLGGHIRYATFGAAPHRQFVIEYNRIPDTFGGRRTTFEVILTEDTQAIRFQYLVAATSPIGFGIESPDQTMGMGNAGVGDLFLDPSQVIRNYALEFADDRPLWMTVSPETAHVPPGGSLDLVATLNAAELAGGDYAAQIIIRSNDPLNPVVPVSVSLHVEGGAAAVAMTAAATIEVPTRYALHPNYPNPFNPTTRIPYDLPRAGDVHLVVYDVQGKVVTELLNESRPAGRHEMVWDGRNSSHEPVASGVYFYRFVTADFVQTRKMVLLK